MSAPLADRLPGCKRIAKDCLEGRGVIPHLVSCSNLSQSVTRALVGGSPPLLVASGRWGCFTPSYLLLLLLLLSPSLDLLLFLISIVFFAPPAHSFFERVLAQNRVILFKTYTLFSYRTRLLRIDFAHFPSHHSIQPFAHSFKTKRPAENETRRSERKKPNETKSNSSISSSSSHQARTRCFSNQFSSS